MKFIVSLLCGLTCLSGLNCKPSNHTKNEDSEYSLSSDVSPYTFENKEDFDAYKQKLRESNASIPRSSESLTFSARDFSNIVDDSSGSYHDSDESGEDSFYYDLNPPRSSEKKSETQTETVRAEDLFKTPEERERIWKERQELLKKFKEKLKGNNRKTFYKPVNEQATDNNLGIDSLFDDNLVNSLVRHAMKQKEKIDKKKKENNKSLEHGEILQQKNPKRTTERNMKRRESQETIYRNIKEDNKTIINETKSKIAVSYDTDKRTKGENDEQHMTRNFTETKYKGRNRTHDNRKIYENSLEVTKYKGRNRTHDNRKIYENSLEVTNASTIDWEALFKAVGESSENRSKNYRYNRGKTYGGYRHRGYGWDKNRQEYNQDKGRGYYDYGDKQGHRTVKDLGSGWDRDREKNVDKEYRRKWYGENREASYRWRRNRDNREDRNEHVVNNGGDKGFTRNRYKKSDTNKNWSHKFQRNEKKYERDFRKDPREIMFMKKLLEEEGNDRIKSVKYNPNVEGKNDSDWEFRKDKDSGNRKERIRDEENDSYVDYEDKRNIEKKYEHEKGKNI